MSSLFAADHSPLYRFMFHEWYFSWPMLLMSLTGLALVIWRLLLNFSARTNMDEFLPAFQEVLTRQGIEAATEFCKAQDGMIPRKLYVAGLESSRQGTAAMRRTMANVIELEILPDLHFLLAPILAIAKIATMVGLFGTVVSMINTFTELSQQKAGDVKGVSSQAQAIGLALFATAMGLMTAIPLVFSHVLFKDWIARFEIKMKAAALKLIGVMQNYKPPGSGASSRKDEREVPAAGTAVSREIRSKG